MASRRQLLRVSAVSAAAVLLGGCAAPPFVATPAQRLRRIGYLSGNALESVNNLSRPFVQRMHDLGYVEGRDITIDWRIADTKIELLPGMAAELLALPVDVMVAESAPAQNAARDATKTVPIVFVLSTDPVGQGLVVSLAHPGRNLTGLGGTSATSTKRVEILKQAIPGLARLAVLWNANQVDHIRTVVPATEDAAREMGVETKFFAVRNVSELDTALVQIAGEHFDGLLMLPALSVVRERLSLVPDFANKIGLPQIYADDEVVRAGGLMSFSANRAIQHSRVADFVDKILKGANPADLPVEQPTQFDLVLNLATAQRIGLTVPPSVLAQAVEVIR